MTSGRARQIAAWFLLALAGPRPLTPQQASGQPAYDLVILNGRVMDPASGRDEVANVGIAGERIAIITKQRIGGRREIDASGLVVAPGFIDILSSILPTREAHLGKLTDGVTTCFGMHGGPIDVEGYKQKMAAMGPLVNYGRAVGHADLRTAVGAKDPYKAATPAQIEGMRELAATALHAGASGIGFGINYVPGASYEEIFALFEVASKFGVPCHLHARHKGNVFPETMSLAVEEVIAMAAASGARAQVAHLISSTVGSAPLCIRLIEGAGRHGVDVGFDFHVWSRNETHLKSALYDPGWEQRFGGITYGDLYVSDTQEQLTQARFDELRKAPRDTEVQTEFIREEEIEMALRSPISIISSDGGGLVDGKGHPRSVGTFSRLLGRYVRERKIISLMEALRKITLLPANRMEAAVGRMTQKGRLQAGQDADITVFDPSTIRERATYKEPFQPSAGIQYVIVNGAVALDKGKVVDAVHAGQWLGQPHAMNVASARTH